ncbi:MAG: aminoglycoside phosphotransferase family protein, partial [Actinomycetota bacterium]|nr:aminoglycoside phosphotransferase family protein [Actinomycetota bacterium]
MAFPELREDQLRAICERFGLPSGPFGRLPSTGVINAIYTVGEGLVLRVPKNVGVGLRDTYTESVAVPAAVAAGVRTPHLVAFDEACDIVEMPYGVYDRVHAADGEPATDEGWRELGRDLARLHEGVTPASCPDPLNRLDTPGRWTTADDVVASLPGLDEADRAALEPVLRRLEAAVLSWEATGRRRFLHNDVKDTNLLTLDGGYTAIIDWGDAGWGDPTIDLRTLPPDRLP